MEPKNHPIEKEIHLESEPNFHDFGFQMLIFRGVKNVCRPET